MSEAGIRDQESGIRNQESGDSRQQAAGSRQPVVAAPAPPVGAGLVPARKVGAEPRLGPAVATEQTSTGSTAEFTVNKRCWQFRLRRFSGAWLAIALAAFTISLPVIYYSQYEDLGVACLAFGFLSVPLAGALVLICGYPRSPAWRAQWLRRPKWYVTPAYILAWLGAAEYSTVFLQSPAGDPLIDWSTMPHAAATALGYVFALPFLAFFYYVVALFLFERGALDAAVIRALGAPEYRALRTLGAPRPREHGLPGSQVAILVLSGVALIGGIGWLTWGTMHGKANLGAVSGLTLAVLGCGLYSASWTPFTQSPYLHPRLLANPALAITWWALSITGAAVAVWLRLIQFPGGWWILAILPAATYSTLATNMELQYAASNATAADNDNTRPSGDALS